MLFNQQKREFDPDFPSSLGWQDDEYWGKRFAYNIPAEEAAVGCMAVKHSKAC